ncbi:MAG TPA: XamI family restriction endonuclease [Capsulimonadaceae bacterium]|jgi:hypothetical protein
MSSALQPPIRWTELELENDRNISIEMFRIERMQEPLEAYLKAFDIVRSSIENVLDTTEDLGMLEQNALKVLVNPESLIVFRYLAGPPISHDDLKTLTMATSLSPAALRGDKALVKKLIEVISLGLDSKRFPWVAEKRVPTPVERESAIVASAALISSQQVATSRRNDGKNKQEKLAADALLAIGYKQAPRRNVTTMLNAPNPGEFCGEAKLGSRKADLIVRLWDGRIMPIECKVSNSTLNSVKRLNNDAAAKAEAWTKDFGMTQIVPVAVLSGVFGLRHLIDAQDRNLTLCWSHRIDDLTSWIESTKP